MSDSSRDECLRRISQELSLIRRLYAMRMLSRQTEGTGYLNHEEDFIQDCAKEEDFIQDCANNGTPDAPNEQLNTPYKPSEAAGPKPPGKA